MNVKTIVTAMIMTGFLLAGLTSCHKNVIDPPDPPGKDACSAKDAQLAINPNNHQFPKQMDACASKSWGNAKKTTKCLKSHYPALSDNCADCFGNMAACSASNCKLKCLSNHFSDKCLDCVTTHCREIKHDNSFSLITCTGIKPDKLPPKK